MDLGNQFSSDWSAILQAARMVLLVTETNVPSLWTLDRRMQALAGIGVNPERMRVIVNRWHKGDEETLKDDRERKQILRPERTCPTIIARPARHSIWACR